MIKAEVKRNENGVIYGFCIQNHGDPLVCSAVSTLALNTVNSITELTHTDISIDFDEDGGFLDFYLENFESDADDALLLLKSLHLGLSCLKIEHSKEFKLIDKISKKKR